ncbi:MAG: hypothetical protein PHY16_19460 [Methylobacter sp.]|nr:hypothetical protein [Methylobacter sp.]
MSLSMNSSHLTGKLLAAHYAPLFRLGIHGRYVKASCSIYTRSLTISGGA